MTSTYGFSIASVDLLCPVSVSWFLARLDSAYPADQGIWIVCCFLGMALPCMMSLQFIRNAPLSGSRVAAMSAEGMAARYPEYAFLLWPLALLISFIVLAPNQISSGDLLPRRWGDVLWTVSRQARRLKGNQVRYLYYGILAIYGVWASPPWHFLIRCRLPKSVPCCPTWRWEPADCTSCT